MISLKINMLGIYIKYRVLIGFLFPDSKYSKRT